MNIVYPPTGRFLEVDLWLPDLNLAFEFQVCKAKENVEEKRRREKGVLRLKEVEPNRGVEGSEICQKGREEEMIYIMFRMHITTPLLGDLKYH